MTYEVYVVDKYALQDAKKAYSLEDIIMNSFRKSAINRAYRDFFKLSNVLSMNDGIFTSIIVTAKFEHGYFQGFRVYTCSGKDVKYRDSLYIEQTEEYECTVMRRSCTDSRFVNEREFLDIDETFLNAMSIFLQAFGVTNCIDFLTDVIFNTVM